MLSWIKKRCRLRPEDSLKYQDDNNVPRYPYPSTDSPLYFRVSMSPFRKTKEQDAPMYDEVYDESPLSSKHIANLPKNQKTCSEGNFSSNDMASLPKNQRISAEINQRICPLCRSNILTDHSCKCVILRRNLRSQRPKIRHNVSLDSLLQLSHDSNHSDISDDDSSGFYESIGSDSISSGDIHSDNSVATDSDDGYEAVEFNPSLGHKRQYSVGSLHAILQRAKVQNARVIDTKGRQPAFQRTTARRSFMVVSTANL